MGSDSTAPSFSFCGHGADTEADAAALSLTFSYFIKWSLKVKERTPCPHYVRTNKDILMIFNDSQKSTGDNKKPVFSVQNGADMGKAHEWRDLRKRREINSKLNGCRTHIEQIVSVHDLFLTGSPKRVGQKPTRTKSRGETDADPQAVRAPALHPREADRGRDTPLFR